ncbi:bacteriochlorophyll 4-vinyl reductase [Tabrizicola aquatica]|uniref:bacteriochlorophyll 4-vinyl reductase n=1 Tax=Tabrizicola aquatica TaxID=909926 RepID=UPI000CD0C25C|nr:bacteriochlorophyll 4-vinyl reductase [Tabrizicola aquatica]
MDGSAALAEAGARIGPNAILQLVPVLDRLEGRAARDRLLGAAGVAVPPADAGMWPEAQCRAAHLAVWQGCGDRAAAILAAAGQGTADYILAHRIPGPAKALIRSLPAPLGARLLTAAIAKHAWTFAGSGRFGITSRRPLTFEISANPLAFPGHPCPWHAAVFARLFQALVWSKARVEATETGTSSRFAVHPR